MGVRVRSREDLDRAARWFSARDCPTQRVPAGATLGLGDAVRVVDPLGSTVEFVHHVNKVERLLQRYDLRHGVSINRLEHININRLEHINIAIPDVPAAYQYLCDLGLDCPKLSKTLPTARSTRRGCFASRLSTTSRSRLAAVRCRITWPSRCRSRITNLNLCDTIGAHDQARFIERGLGRHGVSNAYCLYLRDDDGHRI